MMCPLMNTPIFCDSQNVTIKLIYGVDVKHDKWVGMINVFMSNNNLVGALMF